MLVISLEGQACVSREAAKITVTRYQRNLVVNT